MFYDLPSHRGARRPAIGRAPPAAPPTLPGRVEPRCALNPAPPPQAEVRLGLNGDVPGVPLTTLPATVQLPLNKLPEGDHTLRAEVVVGGQTLAVREQTVSVARDRDDRLRAVAAAAGAEGEPRVDRATLGSLSRLLAKLAAGET